MTTELDAFEDELRCLICLLICPYISPYTHTHTELDAFEDDYDAEVGHYTLQPKGLPADRQTQLMQVTHI